MLALVGIGAQQGGCGEDEKEGHGNKNLTTQTWRIGNKVISLMGGVFWIPRGCFGLNPGMCWAYVCDVLSFADQ